VDISPRFGVAYDLFGDGKTALKGTVNKYVGGATGNLLVTANPVSALVNSTTRSWTDTNKNFIPDCNLLNPLAQSPATTGSIDTCGQIADLRFGTPIPSTPRVVQAWPGPTPVRSGPSRLET
jgi:hypothetical protein